MDRQSKIFVAGGTTTIGTAILTELERQGYVNVFGTGTDEPDLLNQKSVNTFFDRTRPEYVICAAGKSGGISANQKYPADLILDNLLVECHVIHAAYLYGVTKLLYLASSCSYPRNCAQPIKEDYLLNGPLEITNEAYAVAKIAGLKLCQAYRKQHKKNFIGAIPANYFGPGDDFSLENSHVIGALMRRMHEAKQRREEKVVIWGTGRAIRDFIYVRDLAKACLFTLEHYEDEKPINLGSGCGISIGQLAEKIRMVTGFRGKLIYDSTKPDGMPEKVLDSEKLQGLGWKTECSFDDGLKKTYSWFVEQEHTNCPTL